MILKIWKTNFCQMGEALEVPLAQMLYLTTLDLFKIMWDQKILRLKKEQWYHCNIKTMIILGYWLDCQWIQNFIDSKWISTKKHQLLEVKLKKYFKNKGLKRWGEILNEWNLRMREDSNMKNGLRIRNEKFLQQSLETKQTLVTILKDQVWFNLLQGKTQWAHTPQSYTKTRIW